ncbi:MAG: flagellar hook-length control protein FliK [Pseudomonadota bacterium]
MNLSALPELLLSWVKAQGAGLLQGNKAEMTSPFKVGAVYEGKVLDQLPAGRHLVQVAGQKLDMALPRGTPNGDTVRLTFLNAGPRPTFLLNQAPVSPVQSVQISSTAQQLNALLRVAPGPGGTNAPAGVGGQGSPATASGPPLQAGPGSASIATAMTPAMAKVMDIASVTPSSGPQPASQSLAGEAGRAGTSTAAGVGGAQVSASGTPSAMGRPIVANVLIFQSAAPASPGAPVLPALASANTGLLGQSVDGMRATIASSTNLRPTVIASTATPSDNLLPLRLSQTVKESGLFYEAHLARWTRGAYPFEAILNEPQARLARGQVPLVSMAELAGMPEEAARLAGRQLQMLEGAPFLWQGFAWPGQWMDWLVEERSGGEGEGKEEASATAWSTELNLILPRMGRVNAHLDLRGNEVNLDLKVAEADTAASLQGALSALGAAMEGAGLRVARLTVAAESS